MATTIKPILPLYHSHKQTVSSPTPCISCKPISDPMASLQITHPTRPRGQVAVSVAFNPSGKFDFSLTDDEEGNTLNLHEVHISYQPICLLF